MLNRIIERLTTGPFLILNAREIISVDVRTLVGRDESYG
jgi:hypothetical protein